jgi:hypothetical protein
VWWLQSHLTPCCLLWLLPQVIDETHRFYVSLKSGKRANSEDLSLI